MGVVCKSIGGSRIRHFEWRRYRMTCYLPRIALNGQRCWTAGTGQTSSTARMSETHAYDRRGKSHSLRFRSKTDAAKNKGKTSCRERPGNLTPGPFGVLSVHLTCCLTDRIVYLCHHLYLYTALASRMPIGTFVKPTSCCIKLDDPWPTLRLSTFNGRACAILEVE